MTSPKPKVRRGWSVLVTRTRRRQRGSRSLRLTLASLLHPRDHDRRAVLRLLRDLDRLTSALALAL
jgi:hypothetical protein